MVLSFGALTGGIAVVRVTQNERLEGRYIFLLDLLSAFRTRRLIDDASWGTKTEC